MQGQHRRDGIAAGALRLGRQQGKTLQGKPGKGDLLEGGQVDPFQGQGCQSHQTKGQITVGQRQFPGRHRGLRGQARRAAMIGNIDPEMAVPAQFPQCDLELQTGQADAVTRQP